MMWIYAVLVLLFSEAWSQDPAISGTNQNAAVNSKTTPRVVVGHSAFNLKNDANLTCGNKTWNETIFVIWNISLKYKVCKISFSNEGQSQDSCNDGKSLLNTSSARSYLHIPNFSNDDVGIYKCELVYKGGADNYVFHVAITVPPELSSWFEQRDTKREAVCKAERGKPAANITWTHQGNLSPDVKQLESEGFFTVESHLELFEGMDTANLSCIISHPYWKEEQILVPTSNRGYSLWVCFVAVPVMVALLTGLLCFAQKKLKIQRPFQKSDTLSSKSPVTEDVEEVEPYASYVQRVNSIYNSSADLFT